MNEHSRILERDKLDIAEPLRSPDADLRLLVHLDLRHDEAGGGIQPREVDAGGP